MATVEPADTGVPDRLLVSLLHAGAAAAALQQQYKVNAKELEVLKDRPLEPILPEDLDDPVEDGYVYELWKGDLVRSSPVTIRHGAAAGQLAIKLGAYLDAHPLGRLCVAEPGFRIGPANSVIAPDLAFIHAERLHLFPPDEYGPVSPDLAVEVISPGNTGIEVRDKVAAYLDKGARLVWVLNPKRMQIRVHRADGTTSLLRAADRLDGETLFPGFSVSVRELFV